MTDYLPKAPPLLRSDNYSRHYGPYIHSAHVGKTNGCRTVPSIALSTASWKTMPETCQPKLTWSLKMYHYLHTMWFQATPSRRPTPREWPPPSEPLAAMCCRIEELYRTARGDGCLCRRYTAPSIYYQERMSVLLHTSLNTTLHTKMPTAPTYVSIQSDIETENVDDPHNTVTDIQEGYID